MSRKLPSDIVREIIDKTEVPTNPKYGKKPEDRSVAELLDYGIVNLDKPANPTSHEIAAWVKQILRRDKVGHSGTLDPAVTGLLPIALGHSTRATNVLLPAGKEYICIMHLHKRVPESSIQKICRSMVGEIYQMPPVRSAVKRRLRTRRIYYIDVLQIIDRFILFRVGCQGGTYIRKLCHDIGLMLGVGANMKELRRTRSGPFKEDSFVRLDELQAAAYTYYEQGDETFLKRLIQPIENAFSHLPKVFVRDSAVDAICHGAAVTAPGIVRLSKGISSGMLIAIMTLKGEIIGIGQATSSTRKILQMNSGICIKTDMVYMQTGSYPKLWGV